MNRTKISMMYISIFCLLSISVYAPEKPIDYSDKKNVVISEIPIDEIDVKAAIDNGRGKELTVEQIKAHFDKIKDLNKLDKQKAHDAIFKLYGVNVDDFGDGAHIMNNVLTANSGRQDHVTLIGEVYKDGSLTVDKEGRIVFQPNGDFTELDIPAADKLTVDLNQPIGSPELVKFNEHEIRNGIFNVEDGKISLEKHIQGEDKPWINIDGKIITNSNTEKQVNICFNPTSCRGNFVFLEERGLVASGNNFDITFTKNDKTFKVFANEFGNEYPYFNENDFLKISLGDDHRVGVARISSEKNMLPEIKTEGYVAIDNDQNTLYITNNEVKLKLFGKTSDSDAPSSGSVYAAIIPGGDYSEVYIADNNRIIHVLRGGSSEENNDYTTQNNLRQKLVDNYGVNLVGYFPISKLHNYDATLAKIETDLDIDLSTITIEIGDEERISRYFDSNTLGLTLFERDESTEINPFSDPRAEVSYITPTIVFLSPGDNLDDQRIARNIISNEFRLPTEEEVAIRHDLTHEIGHIIPFLSYKTTVEDRFSTFDVDPFTRKWLELADKHGMETIVIPRYKNIPAIVILNSPPDLIPSEYVSKKKAIYEHQAEIFTCMVYEICDRNLRIEDFMDLYSEELQKYK